MAKQKIKIVILFILIITILIGVWRLYNMLERNKQSFTTNIYDYISPQAVSVININREYNLDKLYIYDPSLKKLIEMLGDNLSFPIVISEYKNKERILIAKVGQEEESEIKDFLNKYIAPHYPPKERQYKSAGILYYTLSGDRFLVCTFYKGIFAVSYNYKPIRAFIDSDPENTFFSDEQNEELIARIRNSTPICMFAKLQNNMLALDYQTQNDSIILDGYILDNNKVLKDSISPDYAVLPYLMQLPDSICIDSISVQKENKPVNVKIFLNKKL
ncbi:hypothetical protein D0T84_18090 [Dysgonomonas sp. 521]|uniref:hypothetical protein n=1 Tax=Dysgonomonas sp. 521 TaxID=2302932 RepID=UPI0013D83CA1|nr:hypothetical protein [Dysgonomonas sp. 521]NDV96803.1 hypothetical protein [Dysgonomonas sp. 521]